jgi:hypothetical protein
MRKLVLFLALSGLSFGATCTTDMAGSWTNTDVWGAAGTGCVGAGGGTGIPGNGDTVTIHHAVTLNSAVTIGLSPGNLDAVRAILVEANASFTTSALTLQSGAVLTLRGDVMLSSNGTSQQAKFEMLGGSTLRFDSTAASAPTTTNYRILTNASGSVSKLWVNTARSGRAVIESVTTGSAGNGIFHDQQSLFSTIDLQVYDADFTDCGTTADGCIEHYLFNGTAPRVEVEGSTFNRTSGIKMGSDSTSSPKANNFIFRIKDNVFTNTLTLYSNTSIPVRLRGSLSCQSDTVLTTGTRLIQGNYFDQGMGNDSSPPTLPGFTIKDNVFDQGFKASATPASTLLWTEFSNNYVRVFRANDNGLSGSVLNSYFYFDANSAGTGTNPHGISYGPRADATVEGMVIEYGHQPSDANLFQIQPMVGGPYTYTVKNNLFIPSSYWAPSSGNWEISSILHNWITTSASPNTVFTHNTFMIQNNALAAGPSQTNYFGEGGIAPAGSVDTFKSNLGWNPNTATPSFLWSVSNSHRATMTPNALDPTGADYNACYGCNLVPTYSTTGYNGFTSMTNSTNCGGGTCTQTGTVYDVPLTGTVPGVHDVVNVDPQFVDARRNSKRWVELRNSMTAETATQDDVVAYLRTGPGTFASKISDVITWVKGGFAPQNPAYKGMAHDGGDIGAVPVLLNFALTYPLQFDIAPSTEWRLEHTGALHAYAGYSSQHIISPVWNGKWSSLVVDSVTTPANVTWSLWCTSTTATALCSSNTVPAFSVGQIKLDIGSSATPGTYSIVVTATMNGIQTSKTFPLVIHPQPGAVTVVNPTGPTIPILSTWESTMLSGAATYCNNANTTANPGTLSFGNEGQVWYYDGAWVYYQIADYTGNTAWNACGDHIASQYADFIIANNGFTNGWRYFAHGLRRAYERTGTAKYLTALQQMAANGFYEKTGGLLRLIPSKSVYAVGASDQAVELMRETAYASEVFSALQALGQGRNTHADRVKDILISYIDLAVHNDRLYYDQTFMLGLAAEALEDDFALTSDPRIPIVLAELADHIHAKRWNGSALVWNPHEAGARCNGSGCKQYQTDLMNLTVHLFAFVYHVTGDSNYQTKGDELWSHTLDASVTDSGKNFSQNFRSSFRYVSWRQ